MDIFDRQVRELLQNAEEKVPASSWRNVRSRIGGDSSASASWRKVGLAVALACLAAGLVLVGTVGRHNISDSDVVAQVSHPVLEPGVKTEDNSLITDDQYLIADAGRTGSSPILATRRTIVETSEAATADPSPSGQSVGNSPNAEAPVENTSHPVGWNDSFSDMEDLPSETRGISLDLKGAFATNKSSIQFSGSGIQGAPVVVNEGIEELSESSFGLPLTVGVGVRFYLSKRFSLGTGVNYSLLTRRFNGNYYPADRSGTMLGADIHHSLSYIGIPVNAYYDIVQHHAVVLYVFGGGEVERAIANRYTISGGSSTVYYDQPVSGCQYSAQLGLGIEFKLTDFMGIYFDPSLKFYFNNSQPASIRTQQPLSFSGAIGLKFDIKN